jgi:cGMP-dependent protein kinase
MGCGASSVAGGGANGNKTSPEPKTAADSTASASSPKGETGGKVASKDSGDKDRLKKQAREDNKSYTQTLQFLANVQLLKRLPKDQHPQLAAAMDRAEFPAGHVVIKQGDPGAEFFVIKSGEARVDVTTDGTTNTVARLKAGDYFGEIALLRDEPRAATIVAESALNTFKITRQKFQELGLNEKLQFAARKAVGGGRNRVVAKPPTEKTPEERALFADALRKNENLQATVTLDDDRIQRICDVSWTEEVEEGKELITEGDLTADYFYVVKEGSFEVIVSDDVDDQDAEGVEHGNSAESLSAAKVTSRPVGELTRGGSFGELALLYLVPRAATVKAKEKSSVWVIDRTNFKNILMKVSDKKIAEYVRHLDHVTILESLLQEEKKALAQALVEMHFTKSEIIVKQGEAGNTFYILYDGEVIVTKDDVEQVRLTASTGGKAQFFGERALLNNEARAATVTVSSETAKALALDRDSFNMLLGPLEDIIKQSQTQGRSGNRPSQVGKANMKAAALDTERKRIRRKDLARIGLLGCGGFATVELMEHRVSKETYAMKCLSKGYIVQTGMQDSVMNERNILLMTNSPFIIKLFEAYSGSQTLYFLMEAALGGELYATYNRKGLHGSEKHAKYYIAGVVLAFEHLHERHVIYRDLKPENLLLTEHGHLKVTDMGLAKFVIGKTYTTCGTPDYFAPEVIASIGHTNAVDWWTLGILLYELLSGAPPFESPNPMQVYSKVMKGIHRVPFPKKCQGSAEVLIKSLLKKEPSERLPMRPGGVKNVKESEWYKDFDWAAHLEGTMTAPYVPVVKSKTDIANFCARKEDMPKFLEYTDDGSGWDRDFATDLP